MLKRDGRLIAVLVSAVTAAMLMLILLQPRWPDHSTYDRKAPTADYKVGGAGCQPPILAAIEDSRKRLVERDRCAQAAEDYRLKVEDLEQQTRSANAGVAQAELTHYLATLGLWGAVGGFLTLIAAGLAAWYARGAANAARENLEAFINVERADVFVTLEDFHHGTGGVSFNIVASNLGRSSALVLAVFKGWGSENTDDGAKVVLGHANTKIILEGESKALFTTKESTTVPALEKEPYLTVQLWVQSALAGEGGAFYRFRVLPDRAMPHGTCYELVASGVVKHDERSHQPRVLLPNIFFGSNAERIA